MQKVTMFWHGGSNYSPADVHNPNDAEVFDSVADAENAFRARADFDPYYPCVTADTPENGGPSAWLFFGDDDDHPVIGQEYPDRVLCFGVHSDLIISLS